MHFSDLALIDPILRAVAAEGYDTPTPIQQQAIPPILAKRDLLACAQTGTGKTAAFALPILQRLATTPAPAGRRPIRTLVLTPTRELASQIGESFAAYGKHLRLRHTVIFGGVGQQAQERAIAAGPDIVVATPGRLLDLAAQRKIAFDGLEVLVLDEADRMLDMGFIHDVRRVIALLPTKRQTLFFSATMPPEIVELSGRILVDPARVAVAPIATTAEKIAQSVYFVDKADKRALLEHVLEDPAIVRALVFTRTKHGANRVAQQLERARIAAAAIHGNKSQNARERALSGFKDGSTRVLVATDIAARGIDVDGVSHVINFDLPDVAESYVHRIGRTARAGASGIALTFCDGEERGMLGAIERLIRMRIPVVADHPLRNARPASTVADVDRRDDGRAPSRNGHGGRGPQGPSRRPEPPRNGARSAATPEPRTGRPARPSLGTDGQAGAGAAQSAARPGGPQRRPFSARPKRRYVG